jgi:hypothetical protein
MPSFAIIAASSSRCMQRRFGVVSVYRRVTAQGGKVFESWPREDRGVLKNLLQKFQDLASRGKLRISSLCTHTKGQGGVKRAFGEVDAALRSGEFTHVCRSDAKSYDASIRHDILLSQLARLPLPAGLRKWVAAYCQRTLHYGGLYATSSRGISQGGSLSAVLGAIDLTPLDEAVAALPGIFYRHHSSPNHWLNHFPLPRWQGESTTRQTTQKICYKNTRRWAWRPLHARCWVLVLLRRR